MIPNAAPGPSLNFDWGESAGLLRDSVAAFAAAHVAPRAREIDETNAFPRDLWPRMGELGLLGITGKRSTAGPEWATSSTPWRWRS